MILAIVKFVVTENALWYFQLLLIAANIHWCDFKLFSAYRLL